MAGLDPAIQGRKLFYRTCDSGWAAREVYPPTALRAVRGPPTVISELSDLISSSTAAEVARGVSRLLLEEGYSPILEFTLPNGRRLDVAAIGPGGEMLGVEIKVALADLRGDSKWPDYLDYCDLFYFAIPPDFPDEHVPHQTGLIVADRYGGAIVKEAEAQSLHASRRKAVTVSFARCAAERLSRNLEAIALAQNPNLVLPDVDQS
jgi:hypothetical protein